MSGRPIRVGHIDLSFHDASAREVEAVLVGDGHTVERSAAPHEEMFARLGCGEVDVLVSAWLPASHGEYLAPFEADVRKLGILYEPCCFWGVPHYVPDAISSVADLLGPMALRRMERLIQGINPGAGISRFSKAVVAAYELDAAGYHFETGTEADCFDRYERAVAERRWVVVPLWHPQWLNHRYRIRALEEPRGLLGGRDEARIIVRKDAEALIGEPTLARLTRLTLGNGKVSALDDALRRVRP